MIAVTSILNKITTLVDGTVRLYVDLGELVNDKVLISLYDIYRHRHNKSMHILILDEEEYEIFKGYLEERGDDTSMMDQLQIEE